ncbi:hypothetical protein D3C87_1401080 [compost metagenome]
MLGESVFLHAAFDELCTLSLTFQVVTWSEDLCEQHLGQRHFGDFSSDWGNVGSSHFVSPLRGTISPFVRPLSALR